MLASILYLHGGDYMLVGHLEFVSHLVPYKKHFIQMKNNWSVEVTTM